MAGVATAVAAAATTVAGLATAAAKVGSDFESAMAGTSTMFGDVAVDTENLNSKVLALSNSTGLAATEIGKSLYNALSAGIPVTEDMGGAMDYMESCTKLAKAGFTDVDTAVTATAKVLNAYGMELTETDAVQKVMMQTQNKGITTVGELGASLAQVTPTAAAMGVSFENVGAALATMTAQGTPTAQATTQLNALIAELGKSGTIAAGNLEKAAEGTKYAGMSFTDMMDAGVPLNEVLDLLATSADASGLSMIDMFSSIEAGKAALAMAGDNSAAYAENLAAMGTEADVVGDAYAKVTDTLEAKLDILKQSVSNLGIAVYDGMEGPLKDTASMATDWMGEITAAFSTGGLAGAVGALGGVLAEAVTQIAAAAPKMIDAGVGLLQSLLTGIQTNLPALAAGAVGIVTSLVNGIITLLPQLATTAVELLVALANGIAAALPTLIPAAVGAITTLVQGLLDNLPALVDAALQLVVGLMQGLVAAIPVLLEAIPTIITSLVTALLESIPLIIQAGVDLLVSLVTALPQIIATIVAVLPQIISGIITALLDNLPLIVQAGVDLLVALIQALPQIITTIVAALPQIITSVINALIDNIPLLVQAGVSLFVALIQNLPTIIVEIVKAVPQIVAGIVDGFASLAGSIVDIGKNLIMGVWEGITSMGTWIADKVKGFFGGVVDGVKDFLGIHSPSKVFSEIGGYTIEGFADGVDASAGSNEKRLLSTVSGLSTDMTAALGNGGGDAGTQLMGKLTTSASAAMSDVAGVASTSVLTFTNTIVAELGKVTLAAEQVMATLCNAVMAKQPDVVGVTTATVKTMCDTILSKHGEFYAVGVDAMDGFNEGLEIEGQKAIETAQWIAAQIIATMRAALDIHSPSRKMAQLVGVPTAQGFMVGFEDEMAGLSRRMQAAVDAETGGVSLNAAAQAEGRAANSGVTREVRTSTNTVEKVAHIEGDGITGELVRMLGLRLKAEDKRVGNNLENNG
ncbi:MAG: phage tail tape measure protein [Pseudoflavonifractor sp.]